MPTNFDNMASVSKNGSHTTHTAEKPAEANEVDFHALESVFKAMQPGAVFSGPVVSGQYTIITASELAAGGGFGLGKGSVPAAKPNPEKAEDTGTPATPTPPRLFFTSWGGGGGGGASSRPVAMIVIGPEGVKVQPIIDVTKIVLTVLSLWRGILPLIFKGGKKR